MRRFQRVQLRIALLVVTAAVVAPAASASDPLPPVEVTVSVQDARLAATGMAADAGLEDGIHFVNLRYVTQLDVAVRLVAEDEIVLAGPPRVCLVGPFWNPVDAGLSDRCWGEPHLSDLVSELLPMNSDGNAIVPGGEPIEISLTVARGNVRCDYPPGEWDLEVAFEPLIDGVAQPRTYLQDTPVHVAYDAAQVLPYVSPAETRFCSYAGTIHGLQGAPGIDPSTLP
jgi:hypothetical protein